MVSATQEPARESGHAAPEAPARDPDVPSAWVRRRSPIDGAPWLPRACLARGVLWSRLDDATRRGVTMVVAPAGSGKTLGVAGWLQESARGHGARWVNADHTLDVARLEALLGPPGSPGDQGPPIVVVDDAHLLPSSSVRYLDERLDADPEGMRVVVVTRWDLPLRRLVPELLGHLSVLRGDVLRLSPAEIVRLVAEHARTDAPDVVAAIASRADGWCAAVVLEARAAAAAPSRGDFLRRCRAAGPGAADLIAGEVFASLSPRERHLLLCVTDEPTVTIDIAAHLTRDSRAGEVLATLESTGLLVSRVGSGGADLDHEDAADPHAPFHIHPLLREVTRRRLVAGGVDVLQARATVLRAARLDLAHGHTSRAFRRLVGLGEYGAAAQVLADDGPRLLSEGQARGIEVLVRRAGATIETRPDTWTAIAWVRWASSDADSAAHWSGRVVRQLALDPDAVPALQAAWIRLRRARAGWAPVEDAVHAARVLLADGQMSETPQPYLPLLLCELGAAENWLGDLVAAEQHLAEAVPSSRSHGLAALTAESLSHLALTQFMAGREQTCQVLALEAVEAVAALEAAGCDEAMTRPARGRAETALHLVTMHSLPGLGQGAAAAPSPADDPVGRFWQWIHAARAALSAGSVTQAQWLLERPFAGPPLPQHLRVALLIDRAVLGLVSGDRQVLERIAGELETLGAQGESGWVRGVAADLRGDLRLAAALYVEASEAVCRAQPPTRALSLVCAAQVQDYLGEQDSSVALLAEAVSLTRARRCAAPFLGWSSHGTRVGQLLAAPTTTPSEWADGLRLACAERPSIVSAFRSLVATERELGSVAPSARLPMLSPREDEVLHELARGSTYADIAANLFVSQNTVKTHISSLYAKLSVGRRSEALAVARKAHLL